MLRLSQTFQAWIFEVNLLALQALIPYNNKKKRGITDYIRTLTAISFNAIYLISLKKAVVNASDPELNRTIWRNIYACLFSMSVCAFRTTYNHFTQTTASLKPAPDDMRSCYSKIERRRLVPVYRVSYPAFRSLDSLGLYIEKIASPPIQARAPPFIRNGRLNMFSYFEYHLSNILTRLPATFPRIAAFIRGNISHIMNVALFIYTTFYQNNRAIALSITTMWFFLAGEDFSLEFWFFWSLIYHDALEVDGWYYEVRSTGLWSPRLDVRIKPVEGSSMEKYKRDRQELGYTFYRKDEIEAKARHLARVVPNYDHLSFNCQAFVQNLFRRIVAHELPPKGKKPPRDRTLHGYHNQRSNALLFLAILIRNYSRSLAYILWLPWLNYWYEFIIFVTCSWHGKPASNRVALFQLLASTAFIYVFDLYSLFYGLRDIFPGFDTTDIAGIVGPNTWPWYEWILNSDLYLATLSMPILCVNIVVKLWLYDQHCDRGFPRIASTPWHDGFGFEGMELEVKYFASDQLTDGYHITTLGLIPKMDRERVAANAEDTGFDKSTAVRIRNGFHKLADL
ncbi:hypothetical protein F5Y11DRAFT_366565 [Daldinia sp. FL1419]|nr:hypothetical protein F5Y11DRAFT_366565 [Daldinia sp. FL1419]